MQSAERGKLGYELLNALEAETLWRIAARNRAAGSFHINHARNLRDKIGTGYAG